MFNDSQEKKIKQFASVTKLTNICFSKCFNSISDKNSFLSKSEETCILKCVNSYLELNNNVLNQLMNDKQEVNVKNKNILENKT